MIGQSISHYKILEKLGEGGMGVVYKAQDTTLDRLVALKFLPEELSKSTSDSARFLQEAKAAAALNHPSICTIHGIEEVETDHPSTGSTSLTGTPLGVKKQFIVMEFVDGQTLGEKSKSQIPNLKTAIDIAIQIADGLAAAHEKGITHRDIKPDNIMIRKDGIAQIMDFGLAKLRGVSNLTQRGSTVGTARYMSPEQVQGMDIDHRSDIFSFGVLLYELFSGQLPFRGVHETALMYEIVNVDPEPMTTVKTDLPPDLDAIVLECLAKEKTDRFQSAAEISKELRRFKRESSRQMVSRVTRARTIPPSSAVSGASAAGVPADTLKTTIPWLISGVLLLAAIVGFWSPWRSAPPSPPVVRFSLDNPDGNEVDVLLHPGIDIARDGSRIIQSAGNGFFVRDLKTLEFQKLDAVKFGRHPIFTPDGETVLYFEGESQLMKASVSGGAPVVLNPMTTVSVGRRGLVWTSRNTILTSFARGGLLEMPAAGGDFKEITFLDSSAGERTHRWAQELPNGKAVIFTVGTEDSPDYYESATIQAHVFGSGERKMLVRGASSARYSPTGHLLYTRSGVLYAIRFDQDALETSGEPVQMLQGLAGDQATGAMQYALSDNGTLIYVPGVAGNANYNLFSVNKEGVHARIPTPDLPFQYPNISPDGKKVAVAVGSQRESDIYVYDLIENTMTKFTFGGLNITPKWSPDGKQIAYSRRVRGDTTDVMIKRADGVGGERIVWSHAGDYSSVNDWSPDGRTLLLDLGDGYTGPGGLFQLDLNNPSRLIPFEHTRQHEEHASYSPDMKYIAFSSNRSGVRQVYVRSTETEGGFWQISREIGFSPRWSPDGRKLYFLGPPSLLSVSVLPGTTFRHTQPAIEIELVDWARLDVSDFMYDVLPDGSGFMSISANDRSMKKKVVVVMNWFEELKKAFGE